ncbi:MAG: AMED_5909 family protein [Actinophytocola sp.]|uniref:AMED_5909 family protein n=1 Tax=Actinophytocola sp. TaxID=1872138 RepID=UPI003C7565C7
MAQRQAVVPSSLFEAHEVLRRQRPSRDAAPEDWIAFHRRCSEVYTATAKVDIRHRHEAMQYAAIEIRRAREIDPAVDSDS